jgi:hypothetical protein
MAERPDNAKKGKYTPTKMTGQGNEGVEHVHGKNDEQSSQDEEASQEKGEKTPVTIANSKTKRKAEARAIIAIPPMTVAIRTISTMMFLYRFHRG